MLVVFSGLPGVGKTAIARVLATRLHAAYLGVDTIEEALRVPGAATSARRDTRWRTAPRRKTCAWVSTSSPTA